MLVAKSHLHRDPKLLLKDLRVKNQMVHREAMHSLIVSWAKGLDPKLVVENPQISVLESQGLEVVILMPQATDLDVVELAPWDQEKKQKMECLISVEDALGTILCIQSNLP